MGTSGYLLSVTLHVLAACIWVGSGVFLAAGVLPYFRKRPVGELLDFVAWSAPRLRWLGWSSFAVLLVTGVVNLAYRGFEWSRLVSGDFARDPFVHTLFEKLVLVTLVMGLAAYHDFWLGPRTLALRRASPDAPAAQRARRLTIRVGQLNLLLTLLVVVTAVMLVRGRP